MAETVIQYSTTATTRARRGRASWARNGRLSRDKVDPKFYEDVRARLEYQAGHAIVWRDAIVQYFLKQSGIPDEKGRAGKFPGRLEAEDARLTGYKAIDVTPWEDASRRQSRVVR